MAALEIVLLLLAAVFLLYKWTTKNFKFFANRGIPYEQPIPFVGNLARMVFGKESTAKTVLNFYRRNRDHKICGFFNFNKPVFLINDPEIIKKITVKDFDHFPNHLPFFDTNDDPLLEGMLTIMKDQRWKDMRNTLTPIFTAAKMRNMFGLMNECFDESLNFLREEAKGGGAELNMKEVFTRLSNDIIASTAFGLKVNSYVDRNNEFYDVGQSLTKFKGSQMLRFLLSNIAPRLMSLLGISLFDKKKTDYFTRLVIDTMKHREEAKIVRPDMIQLLLEAKNASSQHWSDAELVAQCFIFFFAAFENNANLICATCHELLDNPDIQERLYEEAVEFRLELNGAPLNYDVVSKFKYMDMVISETLRKVSLAFINDRACSKDYKLTDEDGNFVFEFKAGDHIWMPIIGLQHDERYFSNPDEFNPERFSDENKDDIKSFTYLPFGAGPRNCIGNRYALMQAKAMLYHLVLSFTMERSPKSSKCPLDEARGFSVYPMSGYWMRFVPRK